jgi:undecaprenyl phosphate-alpha-L-ara4FN deformylase
MTDRVVGLEVHVDTCEGMRSGVPRLLDLFRKYGIRSTFFVPMGKDHTGWTVKRVFTRKGFLRKAGRAGVVSTYGVKTLMYGLLLPGPEIARRNRELLQAIVTEGHELGIHGLDHVYWHDHIRAMDRARTEAILSKAIEVYTELLSVEPRSFAAPGWTINAHALAFFDQRRFAYSSDTRGRYPFYPSMENVVHGTLQIPSTLPTLDEMVGLEGNTPAELARYFLGCLADGLNVISVHTELEGKRWTQFLARFIERSLAAGFRFERLIDIAEAVKREGGIPVCDCVYGYVRGRAGEVTLQGKERS